jgi:hypothetical protein
MRHIDYGLGVLKASVFTEYPQDFLLDLTTIYQYLLKQGELFGYEVADRFYEIGSIGGLQETRDYLSMKSKPTINPTR